MSAQLIVSQPEVATSHLVPIKRQVRISLPPNIKKVVEVEFRFMNHCYTKGISFAGLNIGDEAFEDGSRHSNRPRFFDQQRYELSKFLVGILDALILHNADLTKSRYDNFYRLEILNHEGIKFEYKIFMRAEKKVIPRSGFKYIKVKVESAFPLDGSIPKQKGGRIKRLAELLLLTLHCNADSKVNIFDAIKLDSLRPQGGTERVDPGPFKRATTISGHMPLHEQRIQALSRVRPCTIRSKMSAQQRMAKPAKMPCPSDAYCKASSTSSPKPLAPMSEATTTMAKLSKIV
jgi:hypothetical protein